MRSVVGRGLLVGLVIVAGCGRESPVPEARSLPTRPPSPTSTPVPPPPTLTPVQIYTVGGEVKEPVEIAFVQPHIPDNMQRNLMGGPPMFKAIVGVDGLVSNVQSVRPVPEGARECMALLAAQISQWRYKPATFKGKPVPVYLTVTLFHRAC